MSKCFQVRGVWAHGREQVRLGRLRKGKPELVHQGQHQPRVDRGLHAVARVVIRAELPEHPQPLSVAGVLPAHQPLRVERVAADDASKDANEP